MPRVREALERIRRGGPPTSTVGTNPFRLASVVSEPAEDADVSSAWSSKALPGEILDLWKVCGAARLFEDQDFGQWGLVLLDPDASARCTAQEQRERQSEFSPDDVVVGEFLGDQELLVVAPSEAGERRVLVALPLDGRTDWYGVGSNLAMFLERYVSAAGEKFWERRS